MLRLTKFIVNKKNYIFLLFLGLAVYCIWGMGQVKIEYDITQYLPDETDTKQALDIMAEEFTTYGSATILVRNLPYERARALAESILEVEGVKELPFSNQEEYYRESSALFQITFEGAADEEGTNESFRGVLAKLEGYDYLVGASPSSSFADDLQKDIGFVLILAVGIIIVVLCITLDSFAEVPLFLLTFGMAALMNMGTNYWFGKISFISNSVCVILQLALAIDYAIILSHRFREEKESASSPEEAMELALAKAIPEIASSSLTTIAGLIALTSMTLKLGTDLGLVLAKSIVLSMISVFLFMPALLLFFNKFIEKTKHRNIIPRITAIGRFDVKARHVLPVIFLVLAVVGGVLSFRIDYVYSTNSIDTNRPSDAQKAEREINRVFGYRNQLVVLVPKGEEEIERKVVELLDAHAEIDETLGVSNVELSANGQTYTLTDKLNYRAFARLIGSDDDTAAAIYGAYAYLSQESAEAGLEETLLYEANRDRYEASILDLLDCAFAHDDFILAAIGNDEETRATYETLRDTVRDAEAQLIGTNYTRVVCNLALPTESSETFHLIETLVQEVKAECPGAIFAGNSMSSYDLDSSFSVDNIKVSVLSIVFVFLILMFTFRSWGYPIPLTLTIQGAIFINFARFALSATNLFFFDYLIVSAIQMGATIDYAIVFTTRYKALRLTLNKSAAVVEALNQAFPTIVTSGTILSVAGFLIGGVVHDPLIATLGLCLGTGVLFSIACVMLVLPALLILFDEKLSKTSFRPLRTPTFLAKLKKEINQRRESQE